ncbi:MAG: hypothetical protein IJB73_03550 [Firmicutes bacterium]|nr:hypothetical protein [Bacillota bacterium]
MLPYLSVIILFVGTFTIAQLGTVGAVMQTVVMVAVVIIILKTQENFIRKKGNRYEDGVAMHIFIPVASACISYVYYIPSLKWLNGVLLLIIVAACCYWFILTKTDKELQKKIGMNIILCGALLISNLFLGKAMLL